MDARSFWVGDSWNMDLQETNQEIKFAYKHTAYLEDAGFVRGV